jgi:hypothetical protein
MGAWHQDGLADSYVGRNVTLTLTFWLTKQGNNKVTRCFPFDSFLNYVNNEDQMLE